MATKNIVLTDSVDIFGIAVVRSRHENYRPPRSVHPARTVPELRPPAPRNSGASPTAAIVNQTSRKRLRFHSGQRLFWICLYCLWPGSLQTLQLFKPDTLVRTARTFDFIGPGSPVVAEAGVHLFHLRCVNLSGRCRETTLAGEHRGFTANFNCSASMSNKRQSQSIGSIILSRHRKRGGTF